MFLTRVNKIVTVSCFWHVSVMFLTRDCVMFLTRVNKIVTVSCFWHVTVSCFWHVSSLCLGCGCHVKHTTSGCDIHGKCLCKENYDGETCGKCKLGYVDFPTCRKLGTNSQFDQTIGISYTLDSASVYQKVKPKIPSVSPNSYGRRPYWSFPIIKKMLHKTQYFSAFVY